MDEQSLPRSDRPRDTTTPIGAFGRRAFLRSAALLGGGALVAPRLGGRSALAAPAFQEPTSGGIYRVLTNEQFPSLDPARAYNFMDAWLSSRALYNRLYAFDQQGQLQPSLADGPPQVSPDGLTYTVRIKPGVAFHNGRAVTAEDVKFSFDRCLWPELESAGGGFLTNIVGYDDLAALTADPAATPDPGRQLAGIAVVDPTTVSFTLVRPQATWPAVMGVTLFGIVPKQEVLDAGQDWGTTTLIGTGPFKLAEWATGERVAFERNPDYFETGKPYLDRVEVELNVTDQVAALRWESGEAEMIAAVPTADLARIRADPTLSTRIREVPSSVWYRFQFANNAEPYGDIRVRQAIAMAIDKQTLAARSQQGVPVDGFLVEGLPQADPDFRSDYPYDPERAKALLREAGVPDGFKTIFWSGGTSPELGELIQADLAAVGLDAELLVLEGSSYDVFKDRIDSGEIPLQTWGFGSDFPDGSSFFASLVCTPQSPPSAWCDPEIDALVEQVNSLPLDDPQRTALIRQVQGQVVNEKVYVVPLYARTALILGQDNVHGDAPDAISLLPILQNVWMDRA